MMRVIKHSDSRLPREMPRDATPLDTSKAGLDRALNSLIWMKVFLITARTR